MKKILVSILFSALFFVTGGTKANSLYPFSEGEVKNDGNLQNQKGIQFANCFTDLFKQKANTNDGYNG